MRLPVRRPNTLALLLGVAILVIAGLSAALIVVTTRSAGGSNDDTSSRPTASPAAQTTPATITVRGSVTMKRYDDPGSDLRSSNWHKLGDLNCEGVGGYDDMIEGATVTVYDSAGSVVGVGALVEGLAAGNTCAWSFEVTGVPEAQFYQVEVSHRGKVSVPRSEAATVSLSLG